MSWVFSSDFQSFCEQGFMWCYCNLQPNFFCCKHATWHVASNADSAALQSIAAKSGVKRAIMDRPAKQSGQAEWSWQKKLLLRISTSIIQQTPTCAWACSRVQGKAPESRPTWSRGWHRLESVESTKPHSAQVSSSTCKWLLASARKLWTMQRQEMGCSRVKCLPIYQATEHGKNIGNHCPHTLSSIPNSRAPVCWVCFDHSLLWASALRGCDLQPPGQLQTPWLERLPWKLTMLVASSGNTLKAPCIPYSYRNKPFWCHLS